MINIDVLIQIVSIIGSVNDVFLKTTTACLHVKCY
jgi:hypothetical protein